MYILDEEDYIRGILASGRKPAELPISYMITMIGKYYYTYGISIEELATIVKNTLLQFHLDGYQEYKYHKKIITVCTDIVTNDASLKKLEYVPLYKNELKIIESLPNDRYKKFLFTLYMIARYMNSNGWINKKRSSDISEIFKLANISMSKENQDAFINYLHSNGYITMAKQNTNQNIKVALSDKNDNEIVYKLKIFKNIGNQYIAAFKSNYRQCKCCGKLIKTSAKNVMYCTSCKETKTIEKYRRYNEKR